MLYLWVVILLLCEFIFYILHLHRYVYVILIVDYIVGFLHDKTTTESSLVYKLENKSDSDSACVAEVWSAAWLQARGGAAGSRGSTR